MRGDQRRNAALIASLAHDTPHTGLVRALAQHNDAPRLDDRRFLGRDLLQGIAQNPHVVQADARHGNGYGVGGAGGIPATSHANLQHRRVYAGLCKNHHRGNCKQIKGRDGIAGLAGGLATKVDAAARLASRGDAVGKLRRRHGGAQDLHALFHMDELWRGIQRALQSLSTKDRRCETRRRGLAVGTRDLDAIKVRVRALELVQHIHHGLKQGTGVAGDLPRIVRDAHRLVIRQFLDGKRATICHREHSFYRGAHAPARKLNISKKCAPQRTSHRGAHPNIALQL